MTILELLRGRLIVSVQPEAASLLGTPALVALLARCTVQNGAAALRIEGLERIRAVRAAVDVPIVGLVEDDEHNNFAIAYSEAEDEFVVTDVTGALLSDTELAQEILDDFRALAEDSDQ